MANGRDRTRWLLCLISLALCAPAHAQPQQAILRYDGIHHPVIGQHGMVASQRAVASQVGAEVLSQGGNAADAAVAVGFALAVVLPRAGNLGGGGFLVLHVPGAAPVALDFRERAPAAATVDMFLAEDGSVDQNAYRASHLSAGVPGSVAGLVALHERYGNLPLANLIAPSIGLAENGFVVGFDLASALAARATLMTRHDATRRQFRRADGELLRAGDLLRQPELAKTLRLIAEQGHDGFYRGSVAGLIAAEMSRGAGLITEDDLAAYEVTWRQPVTAHYRGYEVVSMPPPSSGGVHLIQMLSILEHFDLAALGAQSSHSSHLIAEAMKLAYADRSKHLGDPDFVEVPQAWLTSADYAKALADGIDRNRARPSAEIAPGNPAPVESEDTTHYSVIDADGMAVAVTTTLNFSFGSGITVPGAGFLLNNEMTDFSAKPGEPDAFGLVTGEANAIAPGKRPLSSMTPTLVLQDGQARLATGSPGGSRIINAVLQHIVNMVDFDMNVMAAIQTPRMHHQWLPDRLQVERGFSADTQAVLRKLGHNVVESTSLGSIQAVAFDGERFYGASDRRRPEAGAVAAEQVTQSEEVAP